MDHMMALQLAEAAQVLDARAVTGNAAFHGVSTDSRQLQRDNLFIALQGPHFDGHDFLAAAQARGAAAAAVSRPVSTPLPLIEVADTRLALGRLAAYWRARFSLPVVAITGSNGKTTVRAMTEAILSRMGRTLSTQGNLNNDIGLPLTLTRLGAEDRFAVLEMGANHPGEIDYLAGIAQPTIAVVTNAGPAHLEGFGSLEGVARAKGELFARLDLKGVAVINADDRFAPLWRELAGRRRVVTFGLGTAADVRADWEGSGTGSRVLLRTPQEAIELQLPLPGRHNVMNALAAAAAALAAGARPAAVKAGLESLPPVAGRLDSHHLAGDLTVIDDTYNANPESLQAALDVLALSTDATWLVLGDMGELGAAAEELHREAGRRARRAGVDRLYCLGPLARLAAETFGDPAAAFDDLDALLAALAGAVHGKLTILVKGSRSMRMERVVVALGACADDLPGPAGGQP